MNMVVNYLTGAKSFLRRAYKRLNGSMRKRLFVSKKTKIIR